MERANESDPEKERHKAPVDWACTFGDQAYAFEHTLIEAFPKQLKHDVDALAIISPVVEQLEGVVPKGECLTLDIPIDATSNVKRSDVPEIVDAIADYVKGKWKTLAAVPYGRRGGFITELIEGVPFPIRLSRYSDAHAMGGRFYFARVASNDEAARVERLVTACQKKHPKLSAWKQSGAKTVLIMEDVDIALTNEQLIFEALKKAEEKLPDCPDEVYVVNSCVADPWFVTCLRRQGKTYYDEGERYFEISPNDLDDLTGR